LRDAAQWGCKCHGVQKGGTPPCPVRPAALLMGKVSQASGVRKAPVFSGRPSTGIRALDGGIRKMKGREKSLRMIAPPGILQLVVTKGHGSAKKRRASSRSRRKRKDASLHYRSPDLQSLPGRVAQTGTTRGVIAGRTASFAGCVYPTGCYRVRIMSGRSGSEEMIRKKGPTTIPPINDMVSVGTFGRKT